MALTQSHYRFGRAELAESTHGWHVAEDKAVPTIAPGQPFLLRFCVQANGTGLNNVDFEFQRRLTRAGSLISDWANINNTNSTVCRTGSTTVFTDGQDTTKRLSGTGTFVTNNDGCSHDGTTGGANNDIPASGCSECMIGMQVLGADTQLGDLVEFRLTRDGGVLLDTYAVTPSLIVGVEILATASQDTSLHNSITAGVNKISGTQVQVLCIGMSAADLADATLSITRNVWGTTVVGSTNPADYTQRLYGPDVWVGGQTGKAGTIYGGMIVPPQFTFAEDIPEGVKRVMATFQPNKTVAFGANATILES